MEHPLVMELSYIWTDQYSNHYPVLVSMVWNLLYYTGRDLLLGKYIKPVW